MLLNTFRDVSFMVPDKIILKFLYKREGSMIVIGILERQ